MKTATLATKIADHVKTRGEIGQYHRKPYRHAVVPNALSPMAYSLLDEYWPPMTRGTVAEWDGRVTVGARQAGRKHAMWRAFVHWLRTDDFRRWGAYLLRIKYDSAWKTRVEWECNIPGAVIRPRTTPAPSAAMSFVWMFPPGRDTVPCGTEILRPKSKEIGPRSFSNFRRVRNVPCTAGTLLAHECVSRRSWHGTRTIPPECIRRVFNVTIG